jgi:hypothetical protein
MDYKDSIFQNERITLDGNKYTGCTFINCELIITGLAEFHLVSNNIVQSAFIFEGPALRTIQLLHVMYQGGARELVEDIIKHIRGGRP